LYVSFGSKLTSHLTKYLSGHLAHVLGVDRQELKKKIANETVKLQQILGNNGGIFFITFAGGVSMRVEVDFEEIDKDPSTVLNKDRIATLLVDVGLESLMEEINKLSLEQKSVLCERVDVISLTYDLAASGTIVKVSKRTNKDGKKIRNLIF
jgi:hypothetical protein